jgi:hypothetical protein
MKAYKFRKMKGVIKRSIGLAALSLATVSCTLDEVAVQAAAKGEQVIITFDAGTRWTPNDGDAPDRKVESLRVLIYNSKTGELLWNFAPESLDISDLDETDPTSSQLNKLNIRTGIYDFVFVANEKTTENKNPDKIPGLGDWSSPNLYEFLQDETHYNTLAKLRELYTGEKLNNGFAARTIPMMSYYPGVKVTARDNADGEVEYSDPFDGNRVKTQFTDGGDTDAWAVKLERLAIRLRIDLTLSAEQYNTYQEVGEALANAGRPDKRLRLYHYENGTYLLPHDDNHRFVSLATSPVLVSESGIRVSDQAETIGGTPTGRRIITYDMILPEHMLNTANNREANALKFTVAFNADKDLADKSGYITTGDFLGGDPTKPDYSIRRNTYLHLNASVVQDKLVFTDIQVIDWNNPKNDYMAERGTVIPQSGVPAPPGVLGVNSVTGELTLRGSKEYAQTDVATRTDGKGTLEFGDLSKETVYVVYFKWGSLIGVGGGSEGDVFGKNDIVWAPEGYDLKTLFGQIDGQDQAADQWALVPYVIDGIWPETADLSEGLGDPCAWADNGAFDAWKTPAGNPWGNEIGNPFGTAPQPSANYWIAADVIGAGLPAGVVKEGKNSPDWSMFLPAAGVRNHGRFLGATGSGYGIYWSNTPRGTQGYGLSFNGTANIGPDSFYDPYSGHAIRCVRKAKLEPQNMILYFNPAYNDRLSIGSWGDTENHPNLNVANLAFFKFGSVVGFRNPTDGTTGWDNSYIAFDPTGVQTFADYAPNDYNLYDTDRANSEDLEAMNNNNTLPNVPGYTPRDYEAGKRNVSDPAYHNAPNILLRGKGDPCKLVGYTDDQIRAMSEDEIEEISRNAQWRLPTLSENEDFAGEHPAKGSGVSWYSFVQTSPEIEGDGVDEPAIYAEERGLNADDPALFWFPIIIGSKQFNKVNGWSLPAPGYRDTNGVDPRWQGRMAYYWSSDVEEEFVGMHARTQYLDYTPRQYGYPEWILAVPVESLTVDTGGSIRCVRNR